MAFLFFFSNPENSPVEIFHKTKSKWKEIERDIF